MNKRNKTFARLEESPFCGVAGSTFLHSGPPSRVKAQTRHSERAQAPLARGREGKSLRGEAGGGGCVGVALLLEDIFPGFPSIRLVSY